MLYVYHVNTFLYLEIKDGFMIGRTTGDLIIPDSALSGKHAQFVIEQAADGEALYIMDLGSKNRTMVNRSEIIPNMKIRLVDRSYVEIGPHSFLVTAKKGLSIDAINEICESWMHKNIAKLEGVKLVYDLKEKIKEEITKMVDQETLTRQGIAERELILGKLQQNMQILDQNLSQAIDQELKKFEEAKARINAQAQAKRDEINGKMNTVRAEIQNFKEDIQRINADVEARKKKMAHMKVIGE